MDIDIDMLVIDTGKKNKYILAQVGGQLLTKVETMNVNIVNSRRELHINTVFKQTFIEQVSVISIGHIT